MLLKLPFDLSVSVLEATNVPLEICLWELPAILHSAVFCAHCPVLMNSLVQSQSLRLLGSQDSTKFCSFVQQQSDYADAPVKFAEQPHPFILVQVLRAAGVFNLQELVVDVSRTSLR